MDIREHFSTTYKNARRLFLERCHELGVAVDSYEHPTLVGAQGEMLSVDCALIGNPDAKGLLIISSGVHGAEGFCGSGCQAALLKDDVLIERVRSGLHAILLIHAINPYGFSYMRRVTEEGVDLNRNFVDFSHPRPANKAYEGIHSLLLPKNWPPSAVVKFKGFAWLLRNGMRAAKDAVGGGQYTHPDGLCYGGTGPTWANLTLHEILRTYGKGRAHIAWLDVHTGLGKYGAVEKIHLDRDTKNLGAVREVWGPEVTSMHAKEPGQKASSSTITGLITETVYDECPDAEFLGIALEYGTVPVKAVIQALRHDHWVARLGDAASDGQRQAAKQEMFQAFFGDTDDWKTSIWRRARAAIVQALDVLEVRD